jgi:hypothetical protein
MTDKRFTYSITWNIFLITIGSAILAGALKGIAFSHGFIPGGLFGAASLIYFTTGLMDIGKWFAVAQHSAFYHCLEIHQQAVSVLLILRHDCFYDGLQHHPNRF